MIAIDCHVHTIASSDSSLTYREIRKFEKKGIFACITDHNTMEGVKKLKKEGAKFIPGEEILTKEGEVIGLFIEEEIPPLLSFEETLERIKEQGGIAYAPHPFDYTRKCIGNLAEKCEIIEVVNGKAMGMFNELAKEFAREKGKIKAVGSDAHSKYSFGTCLNLLEIDELPSSPKEFLSEMKKAQFKVTKVPLIFKLGEKIERLVRFLKK